MERQDGEETMEKLRPGEDRKELSLEREYLETNMVGDMVLKTETT